MFVFMLHVSQVFFAIVGICAAGLMILIMAEAYFYPDTPEKLQENRDAVRIKLNFDIAMAQNQLRSIKEATAAATAGDPPYFGPEFDDVFGPSFFIGGFDKNGVLEKRLGFADANDPDDYFSEMESFRNGI